MIAAESGRLRVGMIGVGGVAQKYVGAYAGYPRSELAVVCDVDPAAADAAAAHGAVVAPSAEALVAADIDAVVISTPNFLHHAQAAMALAAGKHVLLQKPMTVTAAEARDLHDLAAVRGVQLGLYMNSLDSPVIRDLKAMIDAGCFGRMGAVNAKLANGRGASFKTADGTATWRGSRQAVGGGSFAMLAYHYVNLAQWLLDQPITGITAVAANLMSPHIEGDDIMAGIATFRDGSFGILESSWCVKGEQMSIHGSEGSAMRPHSSPLMKLPTRPDARPSGTQGAIRSVTCSQGRPALRAHSIMAAITPSMPP